MDWSKNRWGCLTLVLVLALLLAITIYFTTGSRHDAPSPNQGYFPPQQSPQPVANRN